MAADSSSPRRPSLRAERVDSEIKALLLQLQLYQGELETQNAELQRAQQDLATALHRYTELYEQAPVGYVTLDARGRITQANKAARTMLQLPPPGAPPVPFTRYVARHSAAVLRSHLQRGWRDGAAPPPTVRFVMTGKALVRVPLGTADHLYRIAQEGLTNARKHSGAREIVLSIDVQRESITLNIADDGCGRDLHRADSEGMGLRLMQFRASSIGARLASESVLGGGTRVRCICPQPSEHL